MAGNRGCGQPRRGYRREGSFPLPPIPGGYQGEAFRRTHSQFISEHGSVHGDCLIAALIHPFTGVCMGPGATPAPVVLISPACNASKPQPQHGAPPPHGVGHTGMKRAHMRPLLGLSLPCCGARSNQSLPIIQIRAA